MGVKEQFLILLTSVLAVLGLTWFRQHLVLVMRKREGGMLQTVLVGPARGRKRRTVPTRRRTPSALGRSSTATFEFLHRLNQKD